MTDRDETIRRGERARQILEDDLVVDAFAAMRAHLHDRFSGSESNDIEVRERIWLMLQLVGKLESFFEAALANGKFEADRIVQEDAAKRGYWNGVI